MLTNLKNFFTHKFNKNELIFKPSKPLTLGAELEIQLIDPSNYNLCPRVDDILKEFSNFHKIKPEIFKSFLEINSDICETVTELEQDLLSTVNILSSVTNKLGILLSSTGAHPFARYEDSELYSAERYKDLIDRNQWLTRRWAIYGLHVHLGMQSGDECMQFNNFFMHFIPHMLALSGSSPFWQGMDTGLASCRPTIFESMPTSGLPNQGMNWRKFVHLCKTFQKCGAIKSFKDLWWDLRPSPNYGTLEIRICDGTATLKEATAIVAFIHALAHWFKDNGTWVDSFPAPPMWLLRENKWRVIRHGMEAIYVTNTEGDTKPLKDDILEWVNKIEPYITKLKYEKYFEDIKSICKNGTSSQRQKQVFETTNSLIDVVKLNIEEFNANQPKW
ncbi:carboxylate-amine ligase [Candidatus Jidaibacter acanthamoebae]|nr:YbdK family carboxylate-amine ligase [Candidatus Jidaibacter acanthamoeba]